MEYYRIQTELWNANILEFKESCSTRIFQNWNRIIRTGIFDNSKRVAEFESSRIKTELLELEYSRIEREL